jgi:Asp-tRNA(Asn)/Glu-tRNA(Gln) amidotransferase C subunit
MKSKTTSTEVNADTVRTLALVAGITLPEEDVEPLVGALRNHLKGMETLDTLDLDESDPIVTFDPRWR